MSEVVSYQPWQLAEVRKWLRTSHEDRIDRASKMSGLSTVVVRALIERDPKCADIMKGKEKPDKPQTEIPPMPKPPKGPEVVE